MAILEQEGESLKKKDGTWTGAVVEFIDYIAQAGNFSYSFIEANEIKPEEMPDYNLTQNAYIDIANALRSGVVDMLADARLVSHFGDFYFTRPFLYSVYKPLWIVDVPLENRTRLDPVKIFRVFNAEVWVAIVACLAVVVVLSSLKRICGWRKE